MYSRYVQNENGSFERRAFSTARVIPVERPREVPAPPEKPFPPSKPTGDAGAARKPFSGLLPRPMDLEEWLIFTVLILSLLEDGEEPLVVLIAAALYLFFP